MPKRARCAPVPGPALVVALVGAATGNNEWLMSVRRVRVVAVEELPVTGMWIMPRWMVDVRDVAVGDWQLASGLRGRHEARAFPSKRRRKEMQVAKDWTWSCSV